MSFLINQGRFNTQAWNGEANLTNIAGEVNVLSNSRTISLNWGTVPGTNFYQLQVSLFADFRSCFVDTSITDSDYTFTDSQTDDMKRYWRWRPSVSAGADFLQPWSEVGSYWLDTSAAASFGVPENYWAIFDKDDVNDFYFLDLAPMYTIVPRNINRFKSRNRAGTLLSEYLTEKDDINLTFTGAQYIAHQQVDEFRRFNISKRTFFLANYVIGKHGEPMSHIWKVECTEDPSFSMIAEGRPDLMSGSLSLTEV